jgi:hypothetical protein
MCNRNQHFKWKEILSFPGRIKKEILEFRKEIENLYSRDSYETVFPLNSDSEISWESTFNSI